MTGNPDPILEVKLNVGEKFYAESGAMVAMDASLEISGKAKGGIFSALSRTFLNEESFFQQEITATSEGKILLSPVFPGDIASLDVGLHSYCVADGAYLASSDGITFQNRTQSISQTLFAKSGGFFVLEASGQGTLFVSGFGSIHELEVKPGHDVMIDNGHLVAWDASLAYSVSISTNRKSFLSRALHSQISGEGFVLKFSGTGKIWVSSRNRPGFLAWIIAHLPVANDSRR